MSKANAEKRVKPSYYPELPIERILEPKLSFRIDVDEDIDELVYQIYTAGMVIELIVCWPAPGETRIRGGGPGREKAEVEKRVR